MSFEGLNIPFLGNTVVNNNQVTNNTNFFLSGTNGIVSAGISGQPQFTGTLGLRDLGQLVITYTTGISAYGFSGLFTISGKEPLFAIQSGPFQNRPIIFSGEGGIGYRLVDVGSGVVISYSGGGGAGGLAGGVTGIGVTSQIVLNTGGFLFTGSGSTTITTGNTVNGVTQIIVNSVGASLPSYSTVTGTFGNSNRVLSSGFANRYDADLSVSSSIYDIKRVRMYATTGISGAPGAIPLNVSGEITNIAIFSKSTKLQVNKTWQIEDSFAVTTVFANWTTSTITGWVFGNTGFAPNDLVNLYTGNGGYELRRISGVSTDGTGISLFDGGPTNTIASGFAISKVIEGYPQQIIDEDSSSQLHIRITTNNTVPTTGVIEFQYR